MKYGARNQIVGKVTQVKEGTVMCQVTIDVDRPSQLTSVMTMDSLKDLGLKKGDPVKVVVKAIHVLLVRE